MRYVALGDGGACTGDGDVISGAINDICSECVHDAFFSQLTHRLLASSELVDLPSDAALSIEASVKQVVYCSLLGASRYRFNLRARSSSGFSQSASVETWTAIPQPPEPQLPTIVMRNRTFIVINLVPVFLSAGPLTGYNIIVNKNGGTQRNKRQLLPPGILAAKLSARDVRVPTNFVVGDDKLYNGIKNHALQPGTIYSISYVVISELDGISKSNYVTLRTSTVNVTAKETTVTTAPTVGFPGYAFALLAAAVLLIICFIIIIICILKRKTYKARKELEPIKQLPTFAVEPMATAAEPWSTIYSLDENRHLTMHNMGKIELINEAKKPHKKPIHIEDEYANLPKKQCYPWLSALKEENAPSNRFDHLLPYDHSRVILKNFPTSDYINASYIHGYKKQAAYIATQSPFDANSMQRFWWMVAQENTTSIVFLARLMEDGVVKGEQYWPDSGGGWYGDVHVTLMETRTFYAFSERTLEVQCNDIIKTVHLYQYLAWSSELDALSFLEFVLKVRSGAKNRNDRRLVVHCGTGVSRTGVFIAVDAMLNMAEKVEMVAVYKFTEKMRCR